MAAFQIVDQIEDGAIRVNRYFKMKKKERRLQMIAYLRGRERNWRGEQQKDAGSLEMKEGENYFQWQEREVVKVKEHQEAGDLLQAMTEGKVGEKIALQGSDGSEEAYCVIPATRTTLHLLFPIEEPIYDYHVGMAEAPRKMQEELDPGPEEDAIEAEEKPFQEMAMATAKALERIQDAAEIIPIQDGRYRNVLVQMSRLPAATRPVAFTFELDKMIELLQPMFYVMIADQIEHGEEFCEGGLADRIGTYCWLNAIIVPIAKTLAWMFDGVASREEDAYQVRIMNEQGEMQESWRGLTANRAAQPHYWLNLIDQVILSKEQALRRTGGDKEEWEREARKLTTTPKGCHAEVSWTGGLQTKRLRHHGAISTFCLLYTSDAADE